MLIFVTILHLMVCILLTVVILMQSSKGGGLAGAFGGQGGNMGAVFGGRGAGSFLSKATIVLATIFMLGSIAQGLLKREVGDNRSLIQQDAQQQGSASSAADLLPRLPIGQDLPTATSAGSIPATTTAGDTSK